jgi:hypothetical protein
MAKQTDLLEIFPIEKQISDKDLQRFIICNSATSGINKQSFYEFKNGFLERFAIYDGYDRQEIKKECYSCYGTGLFKCNWKRTENCWDCFGSGIYQERTYMLRRYRLNGHVFHRPTDKRPGDVQDVRNIIKGYIKHTQVNDDPLANFLILLWKYDREKCYSTIENIGKNAMTRARYRWKNIMRQSKSQLIGCLDFLKFKRNDVSGIDDLPF